MILGCHCGMSGTTMMLGSVKEALSYEANALMIYTGAPQNTARKALKELHIEEALKLMDEYKIDRKNLIIHAPYIINPATTDLEKRDFCINFLTQEVKRSYAMGSKVIVLHPGNTLGLPVDEAIKNICDVVNQIIENRDFTLTELEKLGFTATQSKANFIFARSEHIGGEELYLALKERGVLVRHFGNPKICEYNRITVGTPEEMDTMVSHIASIIKEKNNENV